MKKFKESNQNIVFIIVLFVSIIISLGIIFYFRPNIINEIKTQYYEYQIEKVLEEFAEEYINKHQQKYNEMVKAHKEFEKEQKRIQKLLKKDHYGGKTPEETLTLFIEALKNKDYKLAAKYCVPWRWEEKEKYLKKYFDTEPEFINEFIEYANNGVIEKEPIVNGYRFLIYKDENKKEYYIMEIIKIEQNGLWKIEKF